MSLEEENAELKETIKRIQSALGREVYIRGSGTPGQIVGTDGEDNFYVFYHNKAMNRNECHLFGADVLAFAL